MTDTATSDLHARCRDEIERVTGWRLEEEKEVERLQRENGSLARAYAACEQMLRERTEQLNMADAALTLAREMRSWQERYFKERTPSALTESKRLEKELDRLLANQPALFGRDDNG